MPEPPAVQKASGRMASVHELSTVDVIVGSEKLRENDKSNIDFFFDSFDLGAESF